MSRKLTHVGPQAISHSLTRCSERVKTVHRHLLRTAINAEARIPDLLRPALAERRRGGGVRRRGGGVRWRELLGKELHA
jgi:hypothetical protein